MSTKTKRQISTGRPVPPSRPSAVSSRYPRKSSPSVRNHQVRSAVNGKHVTTKPKTTATTVEYEDSDTEQDIVMMDIPSIADTSRWQELNKKSSEISPERILLHSGESSYLKVYEVDLNAANVVRINNLEKFTKLRVLDLSCNHIRTIENLQHNADLRELKLYGNEITEIKNLDLCTEICHLLLQHNRIKTIGRGLANLRKLKMLRLDSNQMCRIESRELAACGQLTYLDISSNKIDNLTSLNCLGCLEELYAANNRIQKVTDLGRCRKIQEIDLSKNKLIDISGLKGLPYITTLNLANNCLSNENLKAVGRLKSLEDLNLCANRLIRLEPLIESFPALQVLNVSENKIKEWKQVCCLKKMAALVELYVSGNPFSSEGGEKQSYHFELHGLLPALEILDGAQMKRHVQKSAPIMRPMSASTAVSSRQVENQIKAVEQDMQSFEAAVASRFESLRTSMNTLPLEPPSRASTSFDSTTPRPDTADTLRPNSRCSARSRILRARAFADEHF